MLFPHTVKNSFYKGVLLVRFFQTKNKVIFRAKFWTFIFFPLLMGSQPYSQGISTLRRPFRKEKKIWFNLNQCKIYGDFCGNSHFFKNNGQHWGVRNFRPMSQNFQKNNLQVHSFMLPKFRFHSAFSSGAIWPPVWLSKMAPIFFFFS